MSCMSVLGNMFKNHGRFGSAEKVSKRALIGAENVLGDDHISTLVSVNNLGNLYKDLG
jgi:Tetratricopeptide repeat